MIVAAPNREWSARASDGRVRAADGAPEAVVSALRKLQRSSRWKRLELSAGAGEVFVTRKAGRAGRLAL